MTTFKQMVSTFGRLKVRKRKSWDEISTFAIFLLAIGCWLEAAFYGYVLKQFGPGYVDLANHPGAMTNASFLLTGGLLLLSGVQLFVWGLATKNLTRLLEKRVWPE